MYKENSIYISTILNACYKISLFITIYLLFFAILGLNNPQIITLSRTSVVIFVSFSLILFLMKNIYSNNKINLFSRRISNINILLYVFFTDIFSYLILEIMNVNPNNKSFLDLFGSDLYLLILCIFFQAIGIYIITLINSKIYYLITKQSKVCIISDNQENADEIYTKLIYNEKIYTISNAIHYNIKNIDNYIKDNDVIAVSNIPSDALNNIIEIAYDYDKKVLYSPKISELIAASSNSIVLEDKVFFDINNYKYNLIDLILKRLLDVFLSIISLIIFSPLMLITGILIKLNDGGPIFFYQERYTKDMKIFKMIKFRSMKYSNKSNEENIVLAKKDDNRITKIGKYIRKYRIDELPQIINILRGEMSIVGPRAESVVIYNKFIETNPDYRFRLKVKAGLTGLAQIEGKYNTKFENKLKLDLYYIENFSILTDIKLIFRTLTVFFRSDSTEGHYERNINTPKIINN